MKRCFVALRIADEARQRLQPVIDELGALPPTAARKIRPVKTTSLHLTLKFLGPTPEVQISELTEALAELAACTEPNPGELVGLGAFPSPARPRIVWAGVDSGRAAIASLAGQVEQTCATLGFEPEKRSNQPHVTLARIDRAKTRGPLTALIGRHEGEAFGAIPGHALVLFESQLQRSGAVYKSLAELRLGGS